MGAAGWAAWSSAVWRTRCCAMPRARCCWCALLTSHRLLSTHPPPPAPSLSLQRWGECPFGREQSGRFQRLYLPVDVRKRSVVFVHELVAPLEKELRQLGGV